MAKNTAKYLKIQLSTHTRTHESFLLNKALCHCIAQQYVTVDGNSSRTSDTCQTESIILKSQTMVLSVYNFPPDRSLTCYSL